MQELDDLLEKCGFVKQNNANHDFLIIEQNIGFSLPADYKYYLNNYESFEGFISEQYISLYNFDTVCAFNADIDEEDKLSASILIGSNGACENIGLQYLGSNDYRVAISQYIFIADEYIEIGTSFTDMIQRLNNGADWFV